MPCSRRRRMTERPSMSGSMRSIVMTAWSAELARLKPSLPSLGPIDLIAARRGRIDKLLRQFRGHPR